MPTIQQIESFILKTVDASNIRIINHKNIKVQIEK